MLYDRCILTKRNDEWIGLVEVCQRIGERWRFVAWLMAIIVAFELFRLALAGFWYFNRWEFVILGLALFFRLPPPKPIHDDIGQTIGYSQQIILPEKGNYVAYDLDRFTHLVFGLIDYPWPGRKNVSIEAFALYLAERDGTPHPIVEGSFDKYSCFALARKLSALTKIPIIELGKGQPFSR